jgi:hypothetical protein
MHYRSNSPDGENIKIAISYSAISIRLEDGRVITLNLAVLLGLLRHKLGISL